MLDLIKVTQYHGQHHSSPKVCKSPDQIEDAKVPVVVQWTVNLVTVDAPFNLPLGFVWVFMCKHTVTHTLSSTRVATTMDG